MDERAPVERVIFGTALADIFLLVTDCAVAVAACCSAYQAWRAVRIGKANRRAIEDVHISINSRVDELILATRSLAFAEGVAHQRNASTPTALDGRLKR